MRGSGTTNETQPRWNSSNDMITCYLEQQAAVYSALAEKYIKKNAKDLITLSDEDVTVLEDVQYVRY